jgi:CheY-like chemotaxis protein
MSGLRTLVVDDDEPLLRACASTLGEIPGAEIVQQKLGVHAAEMLGSESFDLVTSDVQMPEVNGIDLLRIGRQPGPNLRIILITGLATRETQQ